MNIELRKLSNIKPYERNPRVNAAAVEPVARSLREFGARQPIVVDEAGVIVVAHTRYLAAQKLGWDTFPVHVAVGMTAAQAKAYRIADNATAAIAEWDKELLPKELFDLKELGVDLDVLGFGDAELSRLMTPTEIVEDDVPDPPADPITKPGDLWLLGEHRVLCGDSTKAEDVARVMDGQKADFVFTDPPYGHNNQDDDLQARIGRAMPTRPRGKPTAGNRPIINDSPEDAARVFAAFLEIAAGLLARGGCCCCCCCSGGGPDPQFARWSLAMDSAIGFKHAVVWDKGGLGMGWHYRRNYEFVLVAEKPGGPCKWYGDNAVPNVIRGIGKIIPSAEQHPTTKPVALPAFFIRLHSQTSEIVADLFLGSGSTLIAAEQLGRRCFGIEISPAYVDVAVKRWEKLTGKKAVLA